MPTITHPHRSDDPNYWALMVHVNVAGGLLTLRVSLTVMLTW
jgi:hypothetical protein